MKTPPVPDSTDHFSKFQFRHTGVAKAFLQSHAVRVLQPDRKDLFTLFTSTSKHLGKPWDQTKSGGYALLIELFNLTPDISSPRERSLLGQRPKKERKKRKAKLARPVPVGNVDPRSDEFLQSYQWRRLRMVVLRKFGARCQCCGASPADGLRMHVDHIKPRKHFPELALVESNLQVLCEVCNHGKGNWDETNWTEPVAPEVPAELHEPLWSKH